MFSSRTTWPLADNDLSRAVALRRASGAPLLDLTESNPTRVGLGFDAALLSSALSNPSAALYTPEPLGLLEARSAVSRYYADKAIAIAPERIVLTASTSEAYAFLFKLLCDPGDDMLVPSPSYPLFEFLAGLESVNTVPYPLSYDGEWHLTRDGLFNALTPRTKAVVLVNPNNPTGSFLKRDELPLLEELSARGIAILSDEVFSDYAFQSDARRVASLLETDLFSFALSGMSKIAALPQLKVGWLVVNGPDALVAEALRRLEIIADTYLSVSGPAQLALPSLLPARGDVQRRIRERTAHNLAALRAQTKSTALEALRLEGGWSALLKIPRTRTELEWALALVEDGVLVHPGFFFDFPSDGFLSVSLLPWPDDFRRGAELVVRRVGQF